MIRNLIINFIALIGISACAVPAKKPSIDDSFSDFGLYVAGERIQRLDPKQASDEKVLQDPMIKRSLSALEKVLEDSPYASLNLRDKNDRDELRQTLLAIQEGRLSADQISSDFSGFCGLSNILAFRTLIDILDNPRRRPHEVKGKIREYVFQLDDRKQMTGQGHLAVEMRTLYFDHVNGRDIVTQREILHWDVEVQRNGYKVVKREGPPDINNLEPFPDTIPLPREKRDPSNDDSIWARNLDHKLFARGKSIYVRSVYRKIDNNPIELLPRTHSYYNITECSCVDIMFEGFPPELKLPPQRAYCLGRCKSPYIVNSR